MENAEKTLLVLDSYLSDLQRAFVCEQLIKKIRKFFPNYKLLLINKSHSDFGLQNKVDYYLNYGDGFMVGYPPKDILQSEAYSKPYVYRSVSIGTIENWMPLTGITDHVAGIYNSFVLSAKIGENLKFDKVYKIEFDTDFDDQDLVIIKKDVDQFKDFLFYGKRKEGKWSPSDHYILDTHLCGFSPKIFEGFDLVKNDRDYWDLCEKIKYYGKWIEYIIPRIFDYNSEKYHFEGIEVEGNLRSVYSNTKFDVVNSPGFWVNKWTDIPKICRLSGDKGVSELENKVGLFFYNEKRPTIEVETSIYNSEKLINKLKYNLEESWWAYYEIDVFEQIKIVSKYTSKDGFEHSYERILEPNKIKDLDCRFLTL